MTAQVAEASTVPQKTRIQEIDNVEEARPWILQAFAGYVRNSLGGTVTVDYRKLIAHMKNRPEEFPIRIQGWSDGRILGLVLDEMSDVKLINVREWKCSCNEIFPGTLRNTCPKCKGSAVSPHNRSNGGVLYSVVRAKPLRDIPGTTMVKVEELEPPEIIIRDVGNVISLMASIMEHGLRTPLSCRRHGVKVQIVDGYRRFCAIKALGLIPRVPCLIEEKMDDKTAYEISGLSNIERLMMRPIEEARFYQGYRERGWGDIPEMSRKFGRSENTIRSRLDLLVNPETVQRALEMDLIDRRMGEHTADFIKDATTKKERIDRERKVEQLTKLVVDEKEIALSSVPRVLDVIAEKGVGVEHAVEIVRAEAEHKVRQAQDGNVVLVEFNGRNRDEFHCVACSSGFEVDWDRKKIYSMPSQANT